MAKLLKGPAFVEVFDVTKFLEELEPLGICHIICTQSLPKSCRLQFDNQSTNVVHEDIPKGCNVEIEIDNLNSLHSLLHENNRDHSDSDFDGAIYFHIQGIGFKIVEKEKQIQIPIFFKNETYLVNKDALNSNYVRLPDGRILKVACWNTEDPPKPRGLEEIHFVDAIKKE